MRTFIILMIVLMSGSSSMFRQWFIMAGLGLQHAVSAMADLLPSCHSSESKSGTLFPPTSTTAY